MWWTLEYCTEFGLRLWSGESNFKLKTQLRKFLKCCFIPPSTSCASKNHHLPTIGTFHWRFMIFDDVPKIIHATITQSAMLCSTSVYSMFPVSLTIMSRREFVGEKVPECNEHPHRMRLSTCRIQSPGTGQSSMYSTTPFILPATLEQLIQW